MYERANLLGMLRLLGFRSSPPHPHVLSVCPQQTAEMRTRLHQDLCRSCSLVNIQEEEEESRVKEKEEESVTGVALVN